MQDILSGMSPIGARMGEALSSLSPSKVDEAQLAIAEGRHDEAAFAFEKLLTTMFAKEMRRSLPEGFFGEGATADVYGGWLDEHLGNALAERRAFGFAAMVKEDLIRLEAAQKEQTP
jgi:Rod binding domain-containing protein